MFRNRKCEFVSSAFGPNHEGGSKKIRRLQRETERGPEEGKLYKQHFISIYLLKVKSAISALSVSLKGKTFHIWRNVFVSIPIGCCSVAAGRLENMGVSSSWHCCCFFYPGVKATICSGVARK